jgi:hypothetical protein
MPKTAKRPTFSWANVSLADQTKLLDLIGGDGHTIWSATALIEDGVPAYVIDTFTTVERSDGSHKGSIYPSDSLGLPGMPILAELRGVYGLTVIRSLASHHGVSSWKMGRGSEARDLTEQIRAKLEKEAGE